MNSAFSHRSHAALGLFLLFVLTACGQSEDEKPASQVAAKVDGTEITVHDVNFALSQLSPGAAQSQMAANRVLQELVNQQLLLQKATEAKLDRDAKVLQTLEAARKRILAQAYLERQIGTPTPPTATQVSEYYQKHPELFEHRRLYRFQEIVIQTKPEQVSLIQEQIGKVRNLPELVNWLSEQKIPYRTATAAKAAEELPLEWLPRLHQMKDGQIVTIPSNGQMQILHLVASQEQGLSEKAAKPLIERFLTNSQRSQRVEAELKKLRAAAKIELVGQFNTPAGATPTTPSPATQTEQPTKPADEGAMDRGISGLR